MKAITYPCASDKKSHLGSDGLFGERKDPCELRRKVLVKEHGPVETLKNRVCTDPFDMD